MTPADAQKLALRKLAFRIEQHMGQFLADQLAKPSAGSIPLMGHCARTGACERRVIDPNHLRETENFTSQS